MRMYLRYVRIWVLQGGLSRNKVAVGESAAGSPPNEMKVMADEDRPYSYQCSGMESEGS